MKSTYIYTLLFSVFMIISCSDDNDIMDNDIIGKGQAFGIRHDKSLSEMEVGK